MLDIPRNRFTDLRSLTLAVKLGGFAARIRGWGFFEPEWWRNYLHVHSFFEVCYAYQGTGLFHINGDDHQVRAGEVFVAKPDEPHEIISSEHDPLGIYFWSYTLVPPQSQTAHAEVDALLYTFLTSKKAASRCESMQGTLDLLTEEIVRREPGYPQAIEGLIAKLLLDTARAVTGVESVTHEQPDHDARETLVRDMVRYLHDNYNRAIRVRDVAAQVHLSERHTNRLFRQVMDVSIKEYLTNFRLEIAAQLLLDRQSSVTQVAYATGYNDVRYFITLFRQHTGLTPTAFRQRDGTRFFEVEG
ncbi:MAG: AraC family transcriptional regulator [Anaerolineae bacterium]|nr:AraC family transcriptional regulator [Anaerolineae bacterium]